MTTRTHRRIGIGTAAALAAVLGLAAGQSAWAEDKYPSKTIEVVTHAGAGGGTDVTTRMMMLRARRTLKADMVVVNKKGGGGAKAMNHFVTRPADGHTILAFTIGHAATVAKKKTKMTLGDIVPIARGTDDPQILMVNCKKSPYKSGKDFVEAQKTKQLSYGTTHVGGIDHISAFMFTKRGGLKQPKIIPFKGGGELATNLVAGNVDVGVLNLAEASAQIDSCDICPIVVLAKARMKPLPDVSTAKELGIDVVFSTVRGFVTHKGVAPEKVAVLEKGLMKAMNHKVYQAFLTSVGLDSSSVVGAKEWGEQIDVMLTDMSAALKELGFVN